MYYLMEYTSPAGLLTLCASESALTGLWIKDQKYFGSALKGKELLNQETPVLSLARSWLDRYFAGEAPDIGELPLEPEGSPFRQLVWDILCKIPYGQTTTYKEIANRVAQLTGQKSMSAQAVGGAVGHNPISIIIPCHRVLGSDGSLTGYAGGIAVKEMLLRHEGVNI